LTGARQILKSSEDPRRSTATLLNFFPTQSQPSLDKFLAEIEDQSSCHSKFCALGVSFADRTNHLVCPTVRFLPVTGEMPQCVDRFLIFSLQTCGLSPCVGQLHLF
jgi:hypothetical protein